MAIDFEYILGESGWAEAILTLDGTPHFFHISYLTDCLGLLSAALVTIHPDIWEDNYQKNTARFEWHFEPSGVVWELSYDRNILHVKIIEYSDIFDKIPSGKVISFQCPYLEFVDLVLASMTSILRKYGFLGYRLNWLSHDFPIGNYLLLMNFRRGPLVNSLVTECQFLLREARL